MTAETRPALIVAGDSRAWWHIDPAVVAQGIDRPRECIVNIAVNSCDSSAVLAAYREFSDRFAPSPIMAISISPYAVNDGVDMDRWVHDEMLWSISPVDRFRLASFKDAVQATFLPERELANRVARMYIRPEPYVPPHEGYWAIGQTAPLDWESDRVRERIRFINEVWLKDALINGIRWRQFAKDLLSLREAGTQVVLLDSPEHPRLAEELHGTAAAASIAAFHRQLNDLGRQMGIPILRGTDPLNDGYWHGAADPDALYCDPVHMNRVGAGLFSKAVGREIRALVDSGMLHLPQNPPGSH